MSLFKRLLNKSPDDARSPGTPPHGMQTMGAQLQRRFAKGVQYNSKSFFNIGIYDYIIHFLKTSV